MLDEYSIEQRATQIFEARSREYFSEVLGCYTAGNYRSAVVMLWSVVVCDLLFKLQHLVDIYEDQKAKVILAEISGLQKDNERSSVWETKLLELVAEQTQLLDIVERENLQNLQRQRHLAAHPVVKNNFQLHRPNRDMARALIRNALDDLLTKAPMLSNKIVDSLVEDIEKASDILIDDSKLKTYLESKYFSRFTPEVEKAVFKALWKFVFRLEDGRCENNRAINYRVLNLLYVRNPLQFQAQIDADRDYFSKIATGGLPIVYLIKFLSRSVRLYGSLADYAKTAIQHAASQDASARCLAWFLSGSLDEHAGQLREWIAGDECLQIDEGTWKSLEALSDSLEWRSLFIRLANQYYTASWSFDVADQRFAEAVRPVIGRYTFGDCIDLIEEIQNNSQTWMRRRAYDDHRLVRAKAIELDPEFDPAQYEDFNRHLD